MPDAKDVYNSFVEKGGILGILREKYNLFSVDWENHNYVKNLVKEANEVYLKIFPHGKKLKTGREVIRRAGTVASYVKRLKRKKDKRLKEIEPLAKKYEDIKETLKQYRDFFKENKHFKGIFEELISKMRDAKISSSKESAKKIFDVIYSLVSLLREIVNIIKKYNKLYYLQKLFIENYNYATLWIEFRYVMTLDTGDDYWGQRVLEVHVQTWSHAELLYHNSTNETMQELFEDILYETQNDWLLNLEEAKDIFEYLSKELLNYMWGTIPRDVPFRFTLYDHNYNMVRIKTSGDTRIPSDWQKYDAKTIKHEYILKTGDIEYAVVRGQKGRLRGKTRLIRRVKTIGDKKVLVAVGIEEEGKQKSITDFIQYKSVKETEKKGQ